MMTNNVLHAEFKTLVIIMFHEHGRIDELRENFNQDTETKKEMENVRTSMTEEYNNCSEDYTRRNQHQVRRSRGLNQ